MKDHFDDFVRLFEELEEGCSIEDLASLLSVSTKTIRNYLTRINEYEKNIDLKAGRIFFDKREMQQYAITHFRYSKPQNREDRTQLIVEEVIVKRESLNIFDLADELMVSYSTLKNDLTHINRKLASRRLRLIIKEDIIQVSGDQSSIRTLILEFLSSKSDTRTVQPEILKKYFGSLVDEISEILNMLARNNHLIHHDLANRNLLGYLCIVVYECKQNKTPYRTTWSSQGKKDDLILEIEHHFHIHLDTTALETLALLEKTGTETAENGKEKSSFLSSWVKDVLDQIEERFGLAVSNKSWINPFETHMSNAYYRATSGILWQNPMKHPLEKYSGEYYNLAVYVALLFYESFSFKLDEDEIAFISLYLGMLFDVENSEKQKIALVLPGYHGMEREFKENFIQEFGKDVEIKQYSSTFDDLNLDGLDWVLSTIPGQSSLLIPVLETSYLFSRLTRFQVSQMIHNIDVQNTILASKITLNRLLSQNLIEAGKVYSDPEQVIRGMSAALIGRGFAPGSIIADLLKREEIASTSFEGFTLLYSFKPTAFRSTLSLTRLKTPIIWNNNQVQIVLLLSLDSKDEKLLFCIYKALLMLLENEKNRLDILHASSPKIITNALYSWINQ